MSTSFRLRYFLGLIPSAEKIDSARTELYAMRNELNAIEKSAELARYMELKKLVHSTDFQNAKRETKNLTLQASPEFAVLREMEKLEKSKPINNYFRFIKSPDFERLNAITASTELARYLELKKTVESTDFIRNKKETESLRYKGSPEYIRRQKHNALLHNKQLIRYKATLSSDEYRLFLEFESSGKGRLNDPAASQDPKMKIYKKFLDSGDYQNLKSVEKHGLAAELGQLEREINSKEFLDRETFLKNNARYETTPDYPIFEEYTRLSKTSEIVFYQKTIHSAAYINYQHVINSDELMRLKLLQADADEQEFKKRVAFLRDKKRYESTPEYALEKEFENLEKHKIISTYHQLKKRPELSFFDQWEVILDENFSDQQLSTTVWEPENYWGSKMAGYSFSQSGELQAYKGLKNIEIRNKVLSIVTKSEKSEGKAWDPAVGLIPRNFDYSSAMINTGDSFRFTEGIVEAKVKFRAEKAITSAFSLTGRRPFPQIDVFRSGYKSVGLGIINQPSPGGTNRLVQIKGLNFDKYHIFRLEVFGNTLTWKINNYEVHREQLSEHPGELFINFIGSLHQPVNGTLLPHHFEIEWVRGMQKK